MLLFDVSQTREVEASGHQWTIGVLPAGKVYEFRRRAAEVFGTDGAEPDAAAQGLWLEASSEIVRWGLRRCDVPGLDLPAETVTYAGLPWPVLTREAGEALARVDHGTTVIILAGEIVRFNSLSLEEALGFKSPAK